MDKWQADVLNVWLGRDKKDKFTALTCGLAVPRQNGKNAVLEIRELYGLVATGEKFLHTAHEVKTARKAFLRLASFFENERLYPELADMVVQIRRTNGQEGIVLNNGGLIEFSARSRGAARGFTVDTVVFDEAQELTDEQLEAIMPTLSAAPSGVRQFIYTGTPPAPQSPGDVFARTRALALKGEAKNLAWHEWSVEEIGDITDRKRWYATNPALGVRLDEEFTETEMRSMTQDGFARERLGWWAPTVSNAVVSSSAWKELATLNPPEDGKLACGVKFSADGSQAAICVALKPRGEKAHIELIDVKPMSEGVTPIALWLLDRKNKLSVVVIDGRSNVDNLVAKLNEGGFPKKGISVPGTKGIVAASTRFYNAIKEHEITHFDQEQLNVSVENSTKRPIGRDGAWAWGSSGEYSSAPVEAASLALWGVLNSKRNPRRKARVL